MGTPKQLLKINGVSMIRRAAEQALDSGCRPVIVVLGANAAQIAPELDELPVEAAVNTEWESGMSSSIRVGLAALLAADSQMQSVILFLGDQPNLTANSLRRLAAAQRQNGSQIAAASCANHLGTPALFPRAYFGELLQLEGQHGAKALLKRYADRVTPVDMPEAACDLDTPQDFMNFASPPGTGCQGVGGDATPGRNFGPSVNR